MRERAREQLSCYERPVRSVELVDKEIAACLRSNDLLLALLRRQAAEDKLVESGVPISKIGVQLVSCDDAECRCRVHCSSQGSVVCQWGGCLVDHSSLLLCGQQRFAPIEVAPIMQGRLCVPRRCMLPMAWDVMQEGREAVLTPSDNLMCCSWAGWAW